MSEVTLLLQAVKAGNPGAGERLWNTVYQELRRMAGAMMAGEKHEVTLSGTALVHEAWLKLCGGDEASPEWDSRGHFFTVAAGAMRRILVDQARMRLRKKRGGGDMPVSLDHAAHIAAPDDRKLLMVNEVLDELAHNDQRKAQIVTLRFFVGYSNEEIAGFLGISEKTVRREWQLARLWLIRALRGVDPSSIPDGPDSSDT